MSKLSFPLWLQLLALGVVSLPALAFAVRALLRDPGRGQPRCPGCWYLMIGLPPQRCPECGRQFESERELYRVRRRWKPAIVALLLAVAPPAVFFGGDVLERAARLVMPRWKTVETLAIGGYRVELLRLRYPPRQPEPLMQVRISYGGTRLHAYSGFNLELGHKSYSTQKRVGRGDDITGRGQPNLIVSEYTGGAHCCHVYWVFELSGGQAQPLAYLNGLHGGGDFADLDGDGILEYTTDDWTFAYWHVPYVASPSPSVILRFKDDRYAVAGDLMRKPAPPPADLAAAAAALHEPLRLAPADPPVELWSRMLDLMYTGHERLAWEFFDQAWPGDSEPKRRFLAEFRAQLAKSVYWPDVRAASFEP
jgi:hypothetical protein